MSSKARKSFDKNLCDIKRLMELHQQEGGTSPGRRYNLEVLNKSAIVLITAYWEAYCEDVAAEALKHIIKHAKTSDVLPKELKKAIAKELEEDKNDIAVWKVADGKWKDYLQSRLEEWQEARNRKLNTPKTENIDALFMSAVGIGRVSKSWKWASMSVLQAKTKLDEFVTLRGSIAHRGKPSESVTKAKVQDYLNFIQKLATRTGGKVSSHVKSSTGKPLW